jgi:hypothetical protein
MSIQVKWKKEIVKSDMNTQIKGVSFEMAFGVKISLLFYILTFTIFSPTLNCSNLLKVRQQEQLFSVLLHLRLIEVSEMYDNI